MNCPKCNGKIIDNCCVKCGYLTNGNKIENREIDKNYELKLFNKDFDIINRNKNLFLVFILGPLYFSYRGYFFLGTVLTLIDFLYFFYSSSFISILLSLKGIWYSNVIAIIITIIFSRLFYIIFSNAICLLIDKYKIKKIKNKYKCNYIDKLKNYKHHKYYLIFTVVLYLIVILMFTIIRRIKNGLL